MKREVVTCDLCGKEPIWPNKHMFHIKVRSTSFLNYANFDTIGADKKIIDICEDCIEDIKEYIKKKHEKV